MVAHPRLSTPFPTYTSPPEQGDKKRKRNRKGKEVFEEVKIVPSKELEPQKGAKIAKRAQRKTSVKGTSVEVVAERYPKVST